MSQFTYARISSLLGLDVLAQLLLVSQGALPIVRANLYREYNFDEKKKLPQNIIDLISTIPNVYYKFHNSDHVFYHSDVSPPAYGDSVERRQYLEIRPYLVTAAHDDDIFGEVLTEDGEQVEVRRFSPENKKAVVEYLSFLVEISQIPLTLKLSKHVRHENGITAVMVPIYC